MPPIQIMSSQVAVTGLGRTCSGTSGNSTLPVDSSDGHIWRQIQVAQGCSRFIALVGLAVGFALAVLFIFSY